MGLGAALVFGSVICVLLGLGSLVNHSGVNFELDARPSTIRGHRIRGLLVLTGLVACSTGLLLDEQGPLQGLWSAPGVMSVLVLVPAILVFALYRPRGEEPGSESDAHGRYAEPRTRLTRRSRDVWVGSFVASVLASAAIALLALT